MKKFVINILIFSSLSLAVWVLFHLMLIHNRSQMLYLGDDVNKVFLGNSTFEYGINDSLIPSSKNFAQNAETIDIIYAKLKLLKESNPQLDTAFIELDDVILLNKKFPSVVSHPYYLTSFSIADYINNFKNLSFDRNMSYLYHMYDVVKIRPLLASNFSGGNITDLGIGGYQDLFRDKLKEDLIKFSKNNTSGNEQKSIPKQNIYYYKAIIYYCRNNNITPIFLANPMHESCWDGALYRSFQKSEFPNVKLLDFLQMELPDSCFGDRVHLNHIGAKIYSDTLSYYICRHG